MNKIFTIIKRLYAELLPTRQKSACTKICKIRNRHAQSPPLLFRKVIKTLLRVARKIWGEGGGNRLPFVMGRWIFSITHIKSLCPRRLYLFPICPNIEIFFWKSKRYLYFFQNFLHFFNRALLIAWHDMASLPFLAGFGKQEKHDDQNKNKKRH